MFMLFAVLQWVLEFKPQTSMITSYGGIAGIVLTLLMMGRVVVGRGRFAVWHVRAWRRSVMGLVAALQGVLGPKFKHHDHFIRWYLRYSATGVRILIICISNKFIRCRLEPRAHRGGQQHRRKRYP